MKMFEHRQLLWALALGLPMGVGLGAAVAQEASPEAKTQDEAQAPTDAPAEDTAEAEAEAEAETKPQSDPEVATPEAGAAAETPEASSEVSSETAEEDDRAWKPGAVARGDYRDIVDFNIFRADRSRLAGLADQRRNPPASKPRETPKDPEPVEVVVEQPPDPDAVWILTGITHKPAGAIVFIEHAETGELLRLAGPGDLAQGEVTSIGTEAIVYAVNGEQRLITVGQTLTGQSAQPTARTSQADASTPSSDAPQDASASEGEASSASGESVAERLQRLRRNRANE